jgi:hypothetical protein
MRSSLMAVAALLMLGCDGYDLRSVNRTVTVGGRYCTNNSTTFGVPIKVLLIVDTSESMKLNDPMGHRPVAAQALVNALQMQGKDVSFAFENFDTAARALTMGFTKDPVQINNAIGQLGLAQGFTNYLDALNTARTIITQDISDTSLQLRMLEQMGVNTHNMRPYYFVVFFSDGIPRMPGFMIQNSDTILAEEELLMMVPPDTAAGITLDTAFLSPADDMDRPAAELLLTKMATVGKGTFISFTNGDQIDFKLFDFEIKRLYSLKQILVYNRTSALPDDAEVPLADSDSDGLADDVETKLGTDPLNPDTDGDGRGDGFEVLMQMDPKSKGAVCTQDSTLDTDHDGLNDCEEDDKLMDKNRFDTDLDMFPDRLEMLSGGNPIDPTDITTDLDFDGANLGEEMRMRTKVSVADKDLFSVYGFQYASQSSLDQTNGSSCFDYKVSNIDVVRTAAYNGREAGINELVIEAIEVPQDRPENEFTLRRLVMPVKFDDYLHNDIVTTDQTFDTISTMEVRTLAK